MEWATDLNMYVMLDWHSIGNMTTGVYQDPMYDTTKEETFGFWRAMSRHFGHNNTVAFFELFNEPAAFGRVSWEAWKTLVEDEIAVIRANTQQVIPLVAGFDWAYDLTPLRLNPIAAEGHRLHSPSLLAQKNPALGAEVGRGLRFCGGKVPPYCHRIWWLRRAGNADSGASRRGRNRGRSSQLQSGACGLWPRDHQVPGEPEYQLDRVVFRSGVGVQR